MNISGPAAVAKPEMLFYAPGDLTVTIKEQNVYLTSKGQEIVNFWYGKEDSK